MSKHSKKTEPKAQKAANSREEKAPKPQMVVFAFRLPEAERTLIHKAAGPGKATRFVVAAILAACKGDSTAFEALAKDARSNLK